jgi:FkbM family methyltransferase
MTMSAKHVQSPIINPSVPQEGFLPANSVGLALPNGLTLCLRSSQMMSAANYVIEEVFGERQYVREGFEIGHDDTIVDIGGNMGIFALWAAPQAPQGRVISVEPIPDLIACLEASLPLNSLENVTPVQKAVGAPGTVIDLSYYRGFNIISHRADFRRPAFARAKMYLKNFKTWSSPETVRAQSVSIGQLLDDHAIDRVNFMKIDCEGGEYDIVRNVSASDWRRIDRIVIEFHEYHEHHRHGDIVKTLQENGFDVVVQKDSVTYRLMRFGTVWAKRRRS